jgi:hypothetical protein
MKVGSVKYRHKVFALAVIYFDSLLEPEEDPLDFAVHKYLRDI